jgi:hypothetical protein
MLDNVTVKLVETKLAGGRMNTDEVKDLLDQINDAKIQLDALERSVRNGCSHKDKNGEKTTMPTGGGMAQCWVCNQEID